MLPYWGKQISISISISEMNFCKGKISLQISKERPWYFYCNFYTRSLSSSIFKVSGPRQFWGVYIWLIGMLQIWGTQDSKIFALHLWWSWITTELKLCFSRHLVIYIPRGKDGIGHYSEQFTPRWWIKRIAAEQSLILSQDGQQFGIQVDKKVWSDICALPMPTSSCSVLSHFLRAVMETEHKE